MSTVYSLCCYKGSSGAAVTMTVANPCVLTLTAHGIVTGLPIVLTTTGALLTGLVAGTTYYARYVAANTFHLYDTEAHCFDLASTTGCVATSGTQSGTHTIWSSYWYNLSADERVNYGSAGSERVYAGERAWQTARSAATGPVFTEILRFADPFSEPLSSSAAITYATFGAYSIELTSMINGERSKAFHNRRVDRGYCMVPGGYVAGIRIERSKVKVDGLRGYGTQESATFIYLVSGFDCEICNNIGTGGSYGYGFFCSGTACKIHDNLAWGGYWGFGCNSYGNNFSMIYNNLAAKCTNTGFLAIGSPVYGNYFNNVALGCATNWSAAPSNPNDGGMKRNAGASGNTPWGTEAITTLSTSHFIDWVKDDFRYTSDSPLIDAGLALVDGIPADMLGALRPNYSAGNAASDEWDCGPFEYDSGNGEPPISCTLSLTGIPSGSEVRLYENDPAPGVIGTEIQGTESWTGGTYEYPYNYTGSDIDIVVQVISDDYEESVTYYTLGGTSQLIPLILKQEENV